MGNKSKKNEGVKVRVLRKTNERYRIKIKKVKEKNEKLKKEISRKDDEIERLRRKLKRARDDKSSRRSTSETNQSREGRGEDHSQARSASWSKSVQRPSKDELTTEVGQVFVEWCNSAGATMVDRHAMFADKVTERLPEAEVSRAFREKNAAGIVFVEDAQDAVEYWVVRIRGRDLLLPQPDRSGFREVEKCFEGDNIAPDEVEEIYPGELRPKEGKRVLKAKGLIS